MIFYFIYLFNLIIIFFFDLYYFYIYDFTWIGILLCGLIKNSFYQFFDFFIMFSGLTFSIYFIKKKNKFTIMQDGDVFLISSLAAWHGLPLMPKFFIVNNAILFIFIKFFKFSEKKIPLGPSCSISSLCLTIYTEIYKMN